MKDPVRRTKIVATVGPASRSPEIIRQLIDAGVNVFRLNFSYGAHAGHAETLREIRGAAEDMNKPIAVLQDLQGPRIRVGELVDHEPVELVAGQSLRITTEPVMGTARRISSTYAALPEDVRTGDAILIDDGRIQLAVLGFDDRDVITEVRVGGTLLERKGMNLPHTPLSAPCLTEKDMDDLRFGVENSVDFVGLSFVRKAADIEELRKQAGALGRELPVIAKIERIEAVENIEEILAEADGVMVARGDLGVETSAADVPVLQKRILAVAGLHSRIDITATQMLETMVNNPQPSRAEATDVANAVFDGTDALMLSAETAIGKYPVEAVRTMAAIAMKAEQHLREYGTPAARAPEGRPTTVAEATVYAACLAARELNADAIVAFTLSGRTAELVSVRRLAIPILALTPRDETYRRLALAWGVTPLRCEFAEHPEDLEANMERLLLESGLVGPGGTVVVIMGATNVRGATNLMRVHCVGERPSARSDVCRHSRD